MRSLLKKLKELVPLLLSPKNVIVKRIGGQEITGSHLLEYFKVYAKVLSSESHLINKEFKEFKASNKKKRIRIKQFFFLNCGIIIYLNLLFMYPPMHLL